MTQGIYETMNALRIMTVPGLHGSGPSHWQTIWEGIYWFSRIEQDNWDNPVFSQWTESLQKSLKVDADTTDVVLVAHSLGCHLVVKSFPLIKNVIKGVFLVAPPDLDSRIIENDLTSFSLPALYKLNVPGYLVYSEDDPYASAAYSDMYGQALGLDRINIGKRGHINSDSSLGDWDEGVTILKQLLKNVTGN
jgi:uncharacterized protein